MRPTLNLKTVLIAIGVLAASFLISLKAMDLLSPRATNSAPPVAELPPLPPASKSSIVVAPVTIALSAIREQAEKASPRNFAGKAENPASQILQDADIGWAAARGPMSVTGDKDVLTLSTPITGKLNVTGSLSGKATGALGDALGSVLGGDAAKRIGAINIKNLNASAEIKGNVVVTSRPKLAAAWHLEPNIGAQVNLGDTNLSVAGAKVNVPAQVKPLIDKTVNDQLNVVAERIRNDPSLRENARVQWAKACRSIPLQGSGSSAALPPLWLEMKPTRAIAAQPRVDAQNVTLLLGLEAETRVTSTQTKPDCPFPDKISIVPPTGTGVNIGVPIDVPFTEINKLIAAQMVGHTYPEDGSGPVEVTVKSVNVVPSGDRLLISLLVRAKEKKSWLGLGAEATVHIWGRPMLDQEQQTLRLADIQLAVESEAAFGLLGAAARAVVPQMQQALVQKATLDLKPIAANAREKIAAVIADFQKSEDGVRVEAVISSLTLADIAFDSKTLRVVAEAGGTLNVAVTKLSGM
ncbi:putative small integral membrane protein [Bradyrhizobium sp. USDA 4472]